MKRGRERATEKEGNRTERPAKKRRFVIDSPEPTLSQSALGTFSQRRRKKRSNRVRHDVLQSVFPSCQTLHQFLLRFKPHEDGSSASYFLQANDPLAYRLTLTRAVIAVPSTAPPLPVAPPLTSVFTMHDIVHRVIQTLCRNDDTKHLLAKGYRKQHHNSSHGIISMWGVESYFPNSIVNILKTPSWQLLLSRIGDVLMTYMLLHTFMFLPLPNNCYMQITGPSLWLSGSGSMMEDGNDLKRQELWTRKDRYYTLPSYASVAHRKRRKEIIATLVRSAQKRRGRRRRMLLTRIGLGSANDDCTAEGSQLSPDVLHSTSAPNMQLISTPAIKDGGGNGPEARQGSTSRRKKRKKRKRTDEENARDRQAKISKRRRKARRNKKQALKLTKGVQEQRQLLDNDDKSRTTERKRKPRLSIWRRRKQRMKRTFEEGDLLSRISFSCDSDDPLSDDEENTTSQTPEVTDNSESPVKDPILRSSGTKRSWLESMGKKYNCSNQRKRRKHNSFETKKHSIRKASIKRATKIDDPFVPRSRIFYANPATGHFGLPPRHTLNRVRCTKMGAKRLLREIFIDNLVHPHDTSATARLSRKKVKNVKLPASLRTLMPIAMHLIRRHHKTNKTKTYSRALHRYCPIPCLRPTDIMLTSMQPKENVDASQNLGDKLYTQEDRQMFVDMSQTDLESTSLNQSLHHRRQDAKKRVRESEALRELRKITSFPTLFSAYSCQYRQVAGFIKAVLAFLLPVSLWGSLHNATILAKSIDEFVRLRRFDQYSIHSTLRGLKLSDMKWLRSVPRPYWDKQLMIQRLIRWIFAQIIIPVIRIHFYVTESGQYGKRTFYYRKPVWAHIYKLAIEEFRQNGVFTEIPPEDAKRLLIKPKRQLGFSFIRFLPKSGGVRPIVNLKRKPTEHAAISVLDYEGKRTHERHNMTKAPCYKVTASYVADKHNKKITLSINKILESTFRIMNHAKSNNPDVLGASVFSYNDIYIRLSTFLNELRQQHKTNKLPRLYIVSMDIRSCFNNINQHKCYEIVEKLLTKDHHLVCRFTTHIPVPTLRRITSRAEGRVMDISEMKPSADFAEEIAFHLKNSIITDQVVHLLMERSETLDLLHQHLFENLIVDRINGAPTFYLQTKGIAQGSVLSSLLCSLVYGDLENTCFKHLPWDSRSLPTFYTPQTDDNRTSTQATPFTQPTQPTQSFISASGDAPPENAKGVLVRLIDDFLYITTSKRMARRFVIDMHKGYPEHGCTVNTTKTQLNFDMTVDGISLHNVCSSRNPAVKAQSSSVISWCGLLINTRSLHVTADYTRYIGTYIAEQLTATNGGRKLWTSILNAVKPKCHALLLDSRINPPHIVALNIYQSFMLCAIKFYCQTKTLTCGPDKNPAFFLSVIFDVVRYMWMLIKSRTSCTMAKQMNCRFPLSRQEVMWLGFKAFATVLRAKQTNFALLLPPVLAKASSIWRVIQYKKVKQRLAYAADPTNSDVFNYIRY